MDLKELLRTQSAEILENAIQSLNCSHLKSYDSSSESENKKRLLNLLTLTQQCVIEKKLLPMKEYAAQIARERFDGSARWRRAPTWSWGTWRGTRNSATPRAAACCSVS